jgi:hypothetical protein
MALRRALSKFKSSPSRRTRLVGVGILLLGVVLALTWVYLFYDPWLEMPPRSGAPPQLHENCSTSAECQEGQTCLTWSYEEKGRFGLMRTISGGTCEFPCEVDSDCVAPMRCLRDMGTGVSACQ